MLDNAVEFFHFANHFSLWSWVFFISAKIAYHNRLIGDIVTKTQPLFTKPLTEEIWENMKHHYSHNFLKKKV